MSKHTSEIVVIDSTHYIPVDGLETPLVILDQMDTNDLRTSLHTVLTFTTAEILVSLLGYPPILPRDDD